MNNDKRLWEYYQQNNTGVFSSTHDRHNRVAKNISRYIKDSSARILEIGFGDGYLLKKLSGKYDCYGADLSSEVVERMRNEITDVAFAVVEADGALSYQDEYFDGFVASEVLEHMSDEELSLSVIEIKRILKKGGYAFVTFPADENLKENECFCPNCGLSFHRWGHKQSWDRKKILEKFSEFEIVKIQDYFVRFEGGDSFEKIFGYVFYIARNIVNLFKKLPNRSYLVILRKK